MAKFAVFYSLAGKKEAKSKIEIVDAPNSREAEVVAEQKLQIRYQHETFEIYGCSATTETSGNSE